MKRSELEQAWPAAEPPPGFPDRVLERLRGGSVLPEPGASRAGTASWLQSRRSRWLLLPVAALALGGLLLVVPTRPVQEGEVIAAEPRVVAIGERAVAELSAGAHVRWSGNGVQQEVQQDGGEVTYRVLPGASFRVQTPYGSVTALGTVFRVSVAAANPPEGEPMKKRWAIAGGSVVVGALLWVSVEQGSVRLSKGPEQVMLAAGQAGSIGADGVPRFASAVPAAPVQSVTAADAERARLRLVADAVRRNAARQRATAQAAKTAAPESGSEPGAERGAPDMQFSLPPAPPATPRPAEEQERREYVRRVMREQYFPVARECYGELLARQPTAGGKVVLEFAIVGDGDAGVVDRVALREDESTLDDPEFTLCMRESMYTAVFQPPPPGARETTIVYPIELKPE